jgi:FkbM family methyltransferase
MPEPDPITAPYGAFALSSFEESLRRFAMALPSYRLRRFAESTIRRVLMSNGRKVADVEVFPGQHARLHMRDNRCEKRVFVGSKTWDREERAAMRRQFRDTDPDQPFIFVDAGANAGFYTLSMLADAEHNKRDLKAIAIEPDPENRRRLEFNLNASSDSRVTVVPNALGSEEGEAVLVQPEVNRGEVRVSETGDGVKVRLTTLQTLLEEAGVERVDIMKMDIEGFEEPVLSTFFGDAPRNLWPRTILLETRHEAGITEGAAGLCLKHGYEVVQQMRQNAVLTLPSGKSS